MVKNKVGGKNTKKGARKNMNESLEPRKLRFVELESEHYGIVTKILGNGCINVLCDDNKERLCIIRRKFAGRNKSSNIISNGCWIIIGLRDWETKKPDKLEKCDLLEIYSHAEKTKLIQESKTNLTILLKHENGVNNNDELNDSIIFTNETNETCDDNPFINNTSNNDEIFDDSEINFDEI